MFASAYDNLIKSGAWLSILRGLGTTVALSMLSLVLGTAVGALFCAASRSRFVALRLSARALISFLRGTPVVLLLMVTYYVVFSGVRVDAMLVAVLAFGLNTGAHMSEIFRAALEGVDRMQVEAARMLGLSRAGAFSYIALPQAVRIARPVYQSAVVSLIQWTSVVGYVAITDLTRTVNNVGSRTGDPFLALFLGMLIYLALNYVVAAAFALTERRRLA